MPVEVTENGTVVRVTQVNQVVTIEEPEWTLDIDTGIVNMDAYVGDYVVTPSASQQVLSTNNRRMTGNVVVNPIPSNWGLITWDGVVITVS